MIITIDGPAGSGKSTVANILADKLGFIHFNSGSVFRAITAFLLENNKDISTLYNAKVCVKLLNNNQHVFVNKKDYTSILRNNEISVNVATFATEEIVQKIAQDCMRNFCLKNNTIVDGRGLGDTVFPFADYKFYLDSSIKERAKRRYKEEKAKNSNITLKEIKTQIAERDYLDKTREIAPLVIPEGAIVIDSTSLTIEDVIKLMLKHINLEHGI